MPKGKVVDTIQISVGQWQQASDLSKHSMSSASSMDEGQAALLHYRSLKHNARLKNIPMVAVVLALSCVVLIGPIVAVWTINWSKMGLVAHSYEEQALLRRSDFTAERLQKSFERCEGSIMYGKHFTNKLNNIGLYLLG